MTFHIIFYFFLINSYFSCTLLLLNDQYIKFFRTWPKQTRTSSALIFFTIFTNVRKVVTTAEHDHSHIIRSVTLINAVKRLLQRLLSTRFTRPTDCPVLYFLGAYLDLDYQYRYIKLTINFKYLTAA